jgi:hypothetical protein
MLQSLQRREGLREHVHLKNGDLSHEWRVRLQRIASVLALLMLVACGRSTTPKNPQGLEGTFYLTHVYGMPVPAAVTPKDHRFAGSLTLIVPIPVTTARRAAGTPSTPAPLQVAVNAMRTRSSGALCPPQTRGAH